jgi:hypothetical protein
MRLANELNRQVSNEHLVNVTETISWLVTWMKIDIDDPIEISEHIKF